MRLSYKLDLAAEIPWEDMPEKKRKVFWDDGVHFTEKGYELMGKLVAKKLVATVSAERGWDAVEEGANVDEKTELKRRDAMVAQKRKLPLKEPTGKGADVRRRKLRKGRVVAG